MQNAQHHIDLTDSELRQAYARRQALQIATRPEPEFPSTGTDRIAARLAEARARRSAGMPDDIEITSS